MASQKAIALQQIQTPLGVLLAGATAKGICLLEFTDTKRLEFQIPRLEKAFSARVTTGSSVFFKQLESQLNAYFAGSRRDFSDLPLDLRGTDFQIRTWQALCEIPYGETRSYQQQAQAMNRPKAIRAVANANRNNRISIVIPCHRVIGKNGSLTGYGGGLWRKEFLLALEKSKYLEKQSSAG